MNWDWTIIIAVCTSLLAATSAILQFYKERKEKMENLEKEKIAAQTQADLQSELKENYKLMKKDADKIILLQHENKAEIKKKTDKIISLQDELDSANKLLISQQKESLNYLTGGDELMTLYPSQMQTPNDSIKIRLTINQNILNLRYV